MTTLTIEGSAIKSINDFHRAIKKGLGFPNYYGENLDALWDCLAYTDPPVDIVWKDFEKSKPYLGHYSQKIIDLFSAAEKEYGGITITYS